MTGYEAVVEIVAANPGAATDDVREIVSSQGGDPDTAVELLEQAVESEDVVEADGQHWIVRKGKYAFSEYDHKTA